jgi:hypothetical protein
MEQSSGMSCRENENSYSLVMPREGEASSTPRPLVGPLPPLEYWIARSSRAMTAE